MNRLFLMSRQIGLPHALLIALFLLLLTPLAAQAATVAAGTNPGAAALNPLTNKTYVANYDSATVTVIDGASNATSTVAVGTNPLAVAVNPVTNKIYVVNSGSNDVTVIDGATNATSTITAGTNPYAVAVNPVTNKIYVSNRGSASVTVIDGATNATSTVAVGIYPLALAINPVSNKVYVANWSSANVTVIDGDTNATSTVAAGLNPRSVAVNPVTNKIYVVNNGSSSFNVTVIDGATPTATSTVAVGAWPATVAVNPVTNKIYVTNNGSANVTVIDGATNATSTVAVGTQPFGVAVNVVTNKIYVVNELSNNVTVIDGATNSTSTAAVGAYPLSVALNPVTNRIYVANRNSNDVTVIDGAVNATSTVAAGTWPKAVAANPVTNKIYVANDVSNDVTVIDGASNATVTVATGAIPRAVAVNPVTNKIYVANGTSNDVTVIDGASNATVTVAAGTNPWAVAVNPVTNRVYVANRDSSTVTVIDGASNATVTVATGTNPRAVAVNPDTNKIYVANGGSADVTVIDGATNATGTVAVGAFPYAVAVNPDTNKIYVANYNSNNVTVIDGATNIASTVAAGTNPRGVAVNPITNRIYVPNENSNTVTVIDGATNATSTVASGTYPAAVAVNPVTNKIYVANYQGANVTVIDGVTNATSTVAAGTNPWIVAVNPITNRIYVTNIISNNVTVIDEQAEQPIPLTVAITPLVNNVSSSLTPTFSLTATSTFAPPTILQNVYFQFDTWQGEWKTATTFDGSAGTVNDPTPLLKGNHVLYMFATDGQDATSTNTDFQSSPLIGSIAAYPFTVSDLTPPTDGTLTATPGLNQISLSWSGFSDAGGIASYKLAWGINGFGMLGDCSTGTDIGNVTSYDHTDLTNGETYYYRVCAVDSAGNVSSGATASAVPIGVCSWNTAVSGNWSDTSKWSCGHAPGTNDDAIISLAGTYTVTLDTSATVNSISMGGASGTQTFSQSANTLTINNSSTFGANTVYNLSGGTLGGTGDVTISGPFNITGTSTLTGTGLLTTSGATTISMSTAGGYVNLLGKAWTNEGALTVAGDDYIWFGYSSGGTSTLINAAGGTINLSSSHATPLNYYTGTATINNAGTLNQTATGTHGVDSGIAFNNSGTVNVDAGTFQINNSGTDTGTYAVDAGTILSFTGNTRTLGAGSDITGTGTMSVNGGTVNVNNLLSIAGTGTANLSSGTFNLNIPVTLPGLNLSGGTLGGTGDVTVSGPFNITGTSVLTGTGLLTTSGTTTISMSTAGGYVNLLGKAWTNEGALTVAGDDYIWFGYSSGGTSTLINAAGGTINLSSSHATPLNYYTGTATINNAGTLNQTATGTHGIDSGIAFNNSGTVNVDAGAFQINNSGTDTGTYAVDAGTILSFTGSTRTLGAGSDITGAGTMSVNGGTVNVNNLLSIAGTGTANLSSGTFNLNIPVTLPGLNLSGGTLGGSGAVTVSGPFNITGTSVLTGTGLLTTSGATLVSMSTSGGYVNLLGKAWTNEGALTVAGDDYIWFGYSSGGTSTLINAAGGTINLSSSHATPLNYYTGTATINNAGTLNQTATGTHGVDSGIAFNNSGTVNVDAGTFQINNSGTDTGTYAVDAGTILSFTGSTRTLGAGSDITGTGTMSINGGTVNVNNLLSIAGTGTANLSSGTFNLNIPVTLPGLNLSGGTLGGSGAVTVSGPFNITGTSVLTGTGLLTTSGATLVSMSTSGGYINLLGKAWTNEGALTVAGDDYIWFGYSSGGTSTLINVAGGTINLSSSHATPLNYYTGTATINNAGTLNQTATGTHGVDSGIAFNNSGTITVEPGTLSISGALSTNTTNISIGGVTVGTQFGQITTTGAATVAGTLNVSLINGFVPNTGDSFTIMTYSSHTGTFSTVNLPVLGNGKNWLMTYGGSSVSLSVTSDLTPPSVSSTTPAANMEDVPVNGQIRVTFSEEMDPATINSSTFITGVAGTVTYDAAGKTAVFTSSSSLANATQYTVMITTGAKDLAGNPLAADYNWSFTTVGAASWPLTVTKAGTGIGSVSASGLACVGNSCTGEYSDGRLVTITAAPDSGSLFTGWSGACTGTAACDVTMDAAKDVTATFTMAIPTAGLRLWLMADAGVTRDGSNYVSGWADRSGNAFDTVQTAAAKQPLLVNNAVNGRPVIRFDGNDDYLQSAVTKSLMNGQKEWSFFVVTKPGSTQKTYADIFDYTHASYVNFVLQQFGGTTNLFGVDPTTQQLSTAGQQIFTSIHNASTAYTYLNGGNELTWTFDASSLTLVEPNHFSVGNKSSALYPREFNGDIAEIIYYNAALSTADRQAVEDYLAGKYGITAADRTAPLGGISIDAGIAETSTADVLLALSCADTTGCTQMQLSSDDLSYSAPETYAATKTWTLGPEGTNSVYVKFKDAAGNWSAPYSDDIILNSALETNPPAGGLIINVESPTYATSTAVTLTLSCSDAETTTCSGMTFSNDNLTWSAPEGFATTKPWTLLSGNGTKTVYVKFMDGNGNWSSAISDSIVLDTVNPTGSITINNYAAYATSTSVTLNLSASDTSGVKMQFSNDGTTWTSLEAYSTTRAWTLASGDGTKAVYARFEDNAGNSITVSDTITLDSLSRFQYADIVTGYSSQYNSSSLSATQALGAPNSPYYNYYYDWIPSALNGTSEWISLEFATPVYADGVSIREARGNGFVTQVDVIDTNDALQTIWTGVDPTQPGQLAEFVVTWPRTTYLVKGVKIYTDTNHNLSEYEGIDSVLLKGAAAVETNPPTGAVVIDALATYATTTSVTLTLSCSDSETGTCSEMRFSNDNATWSAAETFATAKAWNLSSGDGTKNVYAKFRDGNGNWSAAVSDTIILDATPPSGSITINNYAAFTTSTAVTLKLSASDTNGAKMQFSDDGTAWGPLVSYATTTAWTLPTGDGTKTVYVRFEDNAGNRAVYSDTITLDTASFFQYASVVAGFSSQYNGSSLSATQALGAPDSPYYNYYYDWVPSAQNGTSEWISLEFATPVYADGVAIRETRGNGFVTQIDVIDTNDALQTVWTGVDPTQPGKIEEFVVSWPTTTYLVKGVKIHTDTNHNLSEYEGIDSAQLFGTPSSDTTPPTGTVVIDSLATYATSTAVTLTLTCTDDAGSCAQMRFSNDNAAWSAPEAYSATRAWTLASGDGNRTVYVKFRDTTGNWSSTYSDTIILDSTNPTGSITINNFAAYSASVNVTLNLWASDTNGVKMQFSDDGTNWSSLENYAATKAWTLPAGDGTKTVYVRFEDNAGNGTIYSDSITLDTVSFFQYADIVAGYSSQYNSSSLSAAQALGAPNSPYYNYYYDWVPSAQNGTSEWISLEFATPVYADGVAIREARGNGFVTQVDLIDTDNALHTVWTGIDPTQPGQLAEFVVTWPQTTYLVKGVKIQTDTNHNLAEYEGVDSVRLKGAAAAETNPPAGTVAINSLATYATSTAVTLTLTCTDVETGTCTQMRFSNDNAAWSAPEAYNATKAWNLASGDGTRTVYAKFRDGNGNWSAPASDTVILDTTLPTGSITINNYAAYTTSTAVTLNLSASDTNGVKMQFSGDGTNWSELENHAATKAWTLPSGGGTRTVYVRYQDSAGNVSSTINDTIILDTSSVFQYADIVTGYSSQYNGGSLSAAQALGAPNSPYYNYYYDWVPSAQNGTSEWISLEFATPVYADGVAIRETRGNGFVYKVDVIDLSDAYHTVWTGIDPTQPGKIAEFNVSWPRTSYTVKGVKIYTDTNHNLSEYEGIDSVQLRGALSYENNPPSGSIAINAGAAYVNSTTVTLNLACSDTESYCAEMQFSEDGTNWNAPEEYVAAKAWTLPAGDGVKTVYAKFKDSAGNWSAVFGDTITLDTIAPASTVSPAPGTYTAAQSVTLSANELSTIYYTTDGLEPTTASDVYAGLISVRHTLTLKFFAKDSAGNMEPVQTVVYTINDQTPPTGSVIIDSSAAVTTSVDVTLTLTCVENEGVCSQMMFSNNNIDWTAPVSYATGTAWTLSTGDETKTVYARFADDAGNWSNTYVDTILLDGTAPAVLSTNPANGATGVSVSGPITVTFSEDVTGVDNSTFTVSGVTGVVAYSAGTATFTPDMPLYYGTPYTVTLQTGIADLAGNPLSDTPYSWTFTTEAVSCTPAPSGLVAWWKGENNANDENGMNNGTLMNGATTATGKVGQAFNFDGVNDYIGILDSASLDFTNTISVDGWIYFRGDYGWYRHIMYKDGYFSGQEGITIALEKDTGKLLWELWGPYRVLKSNTVIQPNRWYHIAVTYDGASQKVYLDGQLDAETATSGSINVNANGELRIGGAADTVEPIFFNGLIDEPQIYNRALTAAEIEAIYNTGANGVCTAPAIALTPSSHDFGDVPVNGSASWPVTIANSGTGPLIVSGITISGAEYTLDLDDGGSATKCGSSMPSIAAGGFCTVKVTVSPTSTGTKNGTLTVTSDDPVNPTALATFTANATNAGCNWTSGVSGNWSSSINWSCGHAPGSNDDAIIDLPGSYTVTVDASSTVRSITVGNASGAQTLSFPNGKTLTLNNASAFSGGGFLNIVSGGTLNNSATLALAGNSISGTIANGTITGATLNSFSGILNNVIIGSSMTKNGIIYITGNLTLADGVNFTIDNSYFRFLNAAATIGLAGGATAATVTMNGSYLAANFGNNSGVVTIGPGVTLQGYGSLMQDFSNGGWVNNGAIRATSGTLAISPTTFNQSGTLTVASGAFISRSEGFTNNGVLAGSGTVTVGTGAAKLVEQGTIDTGGVGATGTLSISGDLQLNSATSINMDIGGATAGQFDKIAVSGAAAIAGNLNLNLINTYTPGYSPIIGDSFTIMTCGSGCNSGAFATTNLPALGPGKKWSIAYNATNVVLSVAASVTVTPATLPDGTTGAAYSQTVTAGGGTAPYTFSVSAGALPDGLTLGAATGEITGTPTTLGPAGFTVRATDSLGYIGEQSYSVFIATSCVPAPSGLVSWWKGEGDANDQFGANNGTLMNGASFAARGSGQAFSFDGVDDYVDMTPTAALDMGTGDFSISFWINLNNLTTQQTFVHKSVGDVLAGTNKTYFVEYDSATSSLRFRASDQSAVNDLYVPVTLSTGQWYFVTAIRNGTTNILYLNGAPIGSQTAGGLADTGAGGYFRIGQIAPNGVSSISRYVNGNLDEIAIYSSALTAAEIQNIYNAGANGVCTNLAPVAVNQSLSASENTPVAITLSATDADGDPLTFSVVTPPAGGTLTGTAPNLTYTPNNGYVGGDSFTFKANDGLFDSNIATVTIEVLDNSAPTVAITTTAANPTSVSPIPVTVTFSEPVTGFDSTDVTVGNGTLSGFAGSGASYTFDITPTATGAVTVDVAAGAAQDGAGNGNSAGAQLSVTYDAHAPVAYPLAMLTPANSDLTLALEGYDADGDPLTARITALPAAGALYQTVDGITRGAPITTVPAIVTGPALQVIFAPAPDTAGTPYASFDYLVSDGILDSAPVSVTIDVANMDATVSLGNLTHTYDGTAKAPTATTNPPGLTVAYSYTDTLGHPVVNPIRAGSYDVTATIVDPVYQGRTAGTMTINPASLTVTATGVNKLYDGTTAATVNYTDDRVPGDVVTISGSASFADKNAGTGKTINVTGIAISGGGQVNYTLATTTATATADITPAPLAVTASAASKVYGSADPPLTWSATGYAAGDTNSVVTGSLARAAGENVGVYPITQGSLAAANYSISFTGATLTITKATPTVTWPTPADITYGTPLDAEQLNASGSVPGAFAYSPGSGAVLDAGPGQTLSAIFTPADTANYDSATASVTINVAKASATVTLGNLSQTYDGTAKSATATTVPPGLTVTFTYDGSATAPTAAGSYTVEGTVSDLNYSGSATGTMTIAPTTISITASSGQDGSISPSGDVAVTFGASQTFTFTPIFGYHIADVVVDGISIGPVSTFTFTEVIAPHTIKVLFAPPDGHLDPSDPNPGVTIADAAIIMGIAMGDMAATPDYLVHGDVAPLVDGRPVPDGKIDLGDVVVILRRLVGLATW